MPATIMAKRPSIVLIDHSPRSPRRQEGPRRAETGEGVHKGRSSMLARGRQSERRGRFGFCVPRPYANNPERRCIEVRRATAVTRLDLRASVPAAEQILPRLV